MLKIFWYSGFCLTRFSQLSEFINTKEKLFYSFYKKTLISIILFKMFSEISL